MRQDPLAFQGDRRARRETKPKTHHYKGQFYTKQEYAGQPITDRENDVYARIVDGWSNKDIAKDLGLAHGTVKEMVFRVLSKKRITRYRLIMAYWKARSWQAGDVPMGDFEF